MLRRTLKRISHFLLAFVLIWATAAGLDAVAEPQACRPEAAPLAAATMPSRGLFVGGAAPGDGVPREMIACAAAVVTLVVLISMINRGRSGGEAADAQVGATPAAPRDAVAKSGTRGSP